MFVSEDKKKLAIYIAEREIVRKNPEDRWFHTSLMLVDETGDKLSVIQELHYSDQDNVFYPRVTVGLSTRAFNNPAEIDVFPVIGGDEVYMLDTWNRILAHACFVKNAQIYFGDGYKTNPFSSNCRDGVIKALHSVGITYHEQMYKGLAGTQARGIPSSIPNVPKEETSLTAIYFKNEELTDKLDINATVGERISCPIRGYFSPICGRQVFG